MPRIKFIIIPFTIFTLLVNASFSTNVGDTIRFLKDWYDYETVQAGTTAVVTNKYTNSLGKTIINFYATTNRSLDIRREGDVYEVIQDPDPDNNNTGDLHEDSGDYIGYDLVEAKTPLNSGSRVLIVIKYSFNLALPIGETLPDNRLRLGVNRTNTNYEISRVFADPSTFTYGGAFYKFHSATLPTTGEYFTHNQSVLADYSTNPIYYPHVGEAKILWVDLNYSVTYDGNTYEYHTETFGGNFTWYQSEF